MRWIDRGPEPSNIQEYANRYTQEWIDHSQNRAEKRPESHWGDFRNLLAECSRNVCWYCERLCQRDVEDIGKSPTVDHFRPLSLFPKLAYEWTNWIFSCHRCNVDNKDDAWPPSGYVDPSTADEQERPEQYFDYDSDTGMITPRAGLSAEARTRAMRTIDDLGLNKIDVRSYRLDWTRRFIADWHTFPASYRPALVQSATQLGFEFAGSTLMAVQAQQSSEGL